jgi:AHBA synthesis associated protein
MSTRAVIFDLDGVVVDSHAVMRKAFRVAYAEVVGPGEAPFAEYERHQGRYFTDIMRLMGLPEDMQEPFVRESYRLEHEVEVYPGMRSLLDRLSSGGCGLAIATGKAGARARSLLKTLGLISPFRHVIGSDEVARSKPEPDIVLRALELLDADATKWGTVERDALLACGPDHVLSSPEELLDLLSEDVLTG